MNSERIPLATIDDFHRHPRRLGWKYEYLEGCLLASPAQYSMAASLTVSPRSVARECQLLPVDEGSGAELAELFITAFAGSVEFCGWPLNRIERHARDWTADFFKGKRGRPLAMSRLAVAGGRIIGAALFRSQDDAPMLDLLFVHPHWQRRGIATALVSRAVNTLAGAGVPILLSRYDLANAASRIWHRSFGFVDLPGWLTARHLRSHAKHELYRRELMGDLADDERERLAAEIDRWNRVLAEVFGDVAGP
jgi:GNAT superfamily N-acetyltransferase